MTLFDLGRRLMAAAAIATVGGLAACAQSGTVITKEWRSENYDPRITRYSAARAGLYAEVVPGRLAAGDADFAERTIEILQGSRAGRAVTLTPDPAAAEASGERLVVLFDPAVATARMAVCAGDRSQTPTREADAGARVLLVFCRGRSPLTSVRARRGDVTSADDPGFRAMLRDAATALFPPRRERDPNDSGDWF